MGAAEDGAHDLGGDGGEHDAVAIVSCGDEVSGDGGRAEDGKLVWGAGAEASPVFVDAGFPDLWDEVGGGLMERLNGVRIDTLIEPDIFDGAADDELSVGAGDNVDAVAVDDVTNNGRRAGWVLWEDDGEHVSLDGTSARIRAERSAMPMHRRS